MSKTIPTVLKAGGEVIDDFLPDLCTFIELNSMLSIYIPVVYGWGKGLTKKLAAAGIESHWHPETQDRITTPEMMPYVKAVSDEYYARIVDALAKQNVNAQASAKVFRAVPESLLGVDYEHLNGRIEEVMLEGLEELTNKGITPIISPLVPYQDTFLNVNGDSAAGALVMSLKPLLYMSVTTAGGVLDADGRIIPEICLGSDYQQLIGAGIVSGGMKKKLYEIKQLMETLHAEGHSTYARILHPQKLLTHPGTEGTFILP